MILDVVYNHTAEGDENGPTICFRGIDNATYYRLRHDGSGRCEDFTGTGNSLDLTHPRVLQMVMDSLRYWIVEMHVDGFRFDLATTLARGPRGEFGGSPFFAAIAQDPVISTVKLIAEPWDVGDRRLSVGNFPVNWKEWNGKYRDGVRDYWRGANDSMGEFASRVTGSSDLYRAGGRTPLAEHQLCHCARRLHAQRISFRTTKNTTRRTARTIATATTRIDRGTAASKDRLTTPRFARFARSNSATSSRR